MRAQSIWEEEKEKGENAHERKKKGGEDGLNIT